MFFMSFLKFFAIIFKRWMFGLKRNYSYYKKFGFVPADGTVIEGIENLHVGKNFSFGIECEFYCQTHLTRGNGKITIGDNVSFNSRVMINSDCGGEITIGSDVLIGPGVIMRSSNHAFKDSTKPIREQGHIAGRITIEDDVWIGAGAIILPDVKIGRGAIVAAGAVVSKDIEAKSIFGGVPARFIKERY